MSWRLRKSESGGGAFMDLGAHLVDLTCYILGNVNGVSARMRTLIAQRYSANGSNQLETVDVDDWALCTLELKNGATGVIEVTRMAAGASEESGFEIYGSKGALLYRESKPNAVYYFSLRKGEWVSGPKGIPPVVGERSVETLWPTSKYSQGMLTNAHLAAQYDLIRNIAENKPSLNDFHSASRVQRIIDAAYISAGRGGENYKLE
jgi:predicted dehydrogenase